MDLMLTSFGLGMKEQRGRSLFNWNDFPPFVVNEGEFTLDYAALLMFDRVIIDEKTLETVMSAPVTYSRQLFATASQEYKQLLESLVRTGRLRVEKFDSIAAQTREIHKLATDHDMKDLNEWIAPLQAAVDTWREAVHLLEDQRGKYRNHSDLSMQLEGVMGALHILRSGGAYAGFVVDLLKREGWQKGWPEETKRFVRRTLKDYLSYVNTNIILAHEFKSAFLDWNDFDQFYKKKFNLTDLEALTGMGTISQSRKLFELFFPYATTLGAKDIVRALDDKRIEHLRSLVAKAVAGDISFDSEFAIETLKGVLRVEKTIAVRKKITGWITFPLGFAPIPGIGIAQKIAEDVISALWAKGAEKEFSWFYLMSSLVDS
jgi:hypothetical protein